MRQKGFAQIFIVILLLAVLGGVIYFGLIKGKGSTTVSTSPPSGTDTTSWQTYINTTQGFSFKYPKDFQEGPSTQSNRTFFSSGSVFTLDVYSFNNKIYSWSDEQFNTIKDYAKGAENMPGAEIFILNGVDAIKTNPDSPGDLTNRIIFLSKDKKLVEGVTLKVDPNHPEKRPEGQSIFNQILSTFKFAGAETGRCHATFPIEPDTGELNASQNYAMECLRKQTESDCLSMDIYNNKTKDFSKPDGVPDCSWTITN